MIQQTIEKILKSKNPVNTSLLAVCLHGMSRLYTAAVKARLAAYRHGIFKTRKLSCRVVSIGNITVGGTGKTPLTMYVAERIQSWGLRAAVISRGYKGIAEKSGAIVGDGSRLLLSAQDAGDEPFLMAARLMKRSVPVLAGHDRIRMGQLAIRTFDPDVILLDDGFQHVRLARDVDVVLLDEKLPFGNQHLLPRGVLREPLSSLQRADLFILTRSDTKEKTLTHAPLKASRSGLPQRPVFRAAHIPVLRAWIEADQWAGAELLSGSTDLDNQLFAGRRVFAFSGLAANDAFRRSLTDMGLELSGFIGFADHHAYTQNDVKQILHAVRSTGADCLCTTDKDWVKLFQKVNWPLELAVMGVDIDFAADAPGFDKALRSRLAAAG